MKLLGRDSAIEDICKLIESPSTRLVTLTGCVGVGKTAIATQIAHEIDECGDMEVTMVSFVKQRSPAEAAQHLSNEIGLQPGQTQHSPSERDRLLVLDNLEHVMPFPEVYELLSASPRLRILTTTRGLLQVSDEILIPVQPLDTPDPAETHSPEDLMSFPSVQLLVERARRLAPQFEVTDENAAAIAELCAALDGLPLAIELAAARLNMFSPRTLCERLDNRFEFLVGGPLDRPDHQRTLRSAFSWGYDLISPSEQRPFYRLSVFEGPVSAEVAAHVSSASFEQLMALSDRNFIHMRSNQGFTITMLNSMRLFAAQKLRESGEEEEVRIRLAEVCLQELARIEPRLMNAEQQQALAELDALIPHVQASLRWLREQHEQTLYTRLAVALFRYWRLRGRLAEAEETLQPSVSEAWSTTLPPTLRAQALAAAAFVANERGEAERAGSLAKQSIAVATSVNDARTLGAAHRVIALLHNRHNQPAQAMQEMEASLAWFREANDLDGIAGSLNNLAILALDDGDWERVVSLCKESTARFNDLGNIHGASHSLDTMGIAQYELKRYGEAMRSTMASLQIDRASSDIRGLAVTLDHVGKIARAMGDLPAAWRAHAESLEYRRQTGDPRGLTVWMQAMAHWLVVAGKAELAAQALGAVEFTRTSQDLPLQAHEQQDHTTTVELGTRALGATAWETELAKGRWRSLNNLIEEMAETAESTVIDLHAGIPPMRDGLAKTYGLTAREEEILHMVARRLSDKEIADQLCISPRTVNHHVGNILMKLDVSSRRDAAAIAQRRNG